MSPTNFTKAIGYLRAPKPAEVATDGLVYAGDTSWLAPDDRSRFSVVRDQVTGWRTWLVVSAGGTVLLRSVDRWIYWRPGYDLLATCDRNGGGLPSGERSPKHQAPSHACQCGIRAYRDAVNAADTVSFHNPLPHVIGWALGEVALWGEIIETPDDWRASHAYPTRILLPSGSFGELEHAEAAREVLAAYGVPVDVVLAQTTQQLISRATLSSGAAATSATSTPRSRTPTGSWSSRSAATALQRSPASPTPASSLPSACH